MLLRSVVPAMPVLASFENRQCFLNPTIHYTRRKNRWQIRYTASAAYGILISTESRRTAMVYKKYTIKTIPEAEDIICAALGELGLEGLEIDDSVPWTKKELDEIFVDEVPVREIPRDEAYISFYLEEGDASADDILTGVKEALEEIRTYAGIGEGTILTSETEDADWLNKWKEYFKSFSVSLDDGRKVDIVPSWEEKDYKDSGAFLIRIDPGTAFGTGAHETTQLCIQELAARIRPGMKVLDIGTGSGILSMMSLKFGAVSVTATDIDSNAEPAVRDNFKKNGLDGAEFRLITGDVLSSEAVCDEAGSGYDLLVANILPVVLIPLASVMRRFLRPGAVIIFSGILTEKLDSVEDALVRENYRIEGKREKGEWSSVTAVNDI